ncbi:hypothetical protein [Paracoccus onubensis]|uniref:Uncharacterized protein n=1 Tax=Paracoccus onubensis TaxID=1675788 RepID=A0A418T1Q9_9RHOB|nr:hypothetical protein [Paracoccus onubensis]RJE87116.1 hypothetical protein D3P04_05030 [Paracoccus onubensis]
MRQSFATACIAQRIQMIEEALEKVLDRGPEMSVGSFGPGEAIHVFVIEAPFSDTRTAYSLHTLARELEVLLP